MPGNCSEAHTHVRTLYHARHTATSSPNPSTQMDPSGKVRRFHKCRVARLSGHLTPWGEVHMCVQGTYHISINQNHASVASRISITYLRVEERVVLALTLGLAAIAALLLAGLTRSALFSFSGSLSLGVTHKHSKSKPIDQASFPSQSF